MSTTLILSSDLVVIVVSVVVGRQGKRHGLLVMRLVVIIEVVMKFITILKDVVDTA